MRAARERGTNALPLLLRSFKLPAFAREYGSVAAQAAAEGLSHEQYLLALSELEAAERNGRRIERLLVESRLPREKTLASYDLGRLPAKVRASVATLRSGEFLDRAENVIAFGNPGTGKTHLLCGLGHELVRQGRPVLFSATFALVQRLLAAKRDLRLTQELRKLDSVRSAAPRRYRLRAAEPRRDGSALHAPGRALRATERADHEQPRVQQMGSDFQGHDDDGGGDRSGRSSLDHSRARYRQLPGQGRTRSLDKTRLIRAHLWKTRGKPGFSTKKEKVAKRKKGEAP